MALPGEKDSEYPGVYLTQVPSKAHRREARWADKTPYNHAAPPRELLGVSPSFIMHEDDLLYFDYGAVRFGRKPHPDSLEDANVVCVGFGWLPGWEFTINPGGLADIKPSDPLSSPTECSSTSEDYDDDDDDEEEEKKKKKKKKELTEPGVLGLLYKLVLDAPPRRTVRSLFRRRAAVSANDLSAVTSKAWDEAIPFHSNLKVLRRVKLYVHVFDGGLGHKYQKDGDIVPFRTPGWTVNAVAHIDPPRLPTIRGELRVSRGRLQGEWVAKELNRWIKEAKLPSGYVDQWLRGFIPLHPKRELTGYKKKKEEDRVGLRKFLGFTSQ